MDIAPLEEPIIQVLLLIFVGFCLGIIVMEFYIIRISKNVIIKVVSLFGIKLRDANVTPKEAWSIINNAVSKIIEETLNEEKQKKKQQRTKTKKRET